MGTAQGMLAQARACLGLGEPNKIQSWYRNRNGSAYSGNFSWCDAAVTYWARHSDNDEVLPAGVDRAYTVYHAQDFQRAGRWHSGTTANVNAAKPGDVVFFDWGGSDSIGNIDHVGVVEVALGGGRVQTIEGNTGDVCARRVRAAGVIAGLGRPAYSGGDDDWMEAMVGKLPLLKRGDTGEAVQTLQGLLIARSHPEIEVDGTFDAEVEAAVKAVQTWGNVTADGEVGPQTWPVLLRVA